MKTVKVINRRRGSVRALNIELNTAQANLLDEMSQKYGKPKSEIVAEAINIWVSMVEGTQISGLVKTTLKTVDIRYEPGA